MAFSRPAALVTTACMLILGIGLVWWTGGTGGAFPHLLYAPILFAAIELDLGGGLATALAASAGVAFMPMSVGHPQTLASIGIHTAAYLTAAISTGAVVHFLRVQQARIQNGFIESVAGLVNALEAADDCTAGHSLRVSELSVAIGESLGLPPADLEVLHIGGLLHDLGKVGVPHHILNKPGRLTPEEISLIRLHPTEGDRILGAFSHPRIREIRDIVRHHHERLDGSGYPDALSGDKLSTLSRIVAVADVYDAVTSPRPYRKSMACDEALAMLLIEGDAGRLDLRVIAALKRLAVDGHLPRKAPEHEIDLGFMNAFAVPALGD